MFHRWDVRFGALAVCLAVVALLGGVFVQLDARQAAAAAVDLDGDDIGGTVDSRSGPQVGVWVIAETSDLPTGFARIVVTDAQGRYVLPDLPDATYRVWVRGYGLVDSAPVEATPGQRVDLRAVVAPDAHAAAEIYPAGYWYSLVQVPPASEFPGTGPQGNGILRGIESQSDWIHRMKEGCQICHVLGTKATRVMPADMAQFDSMIEAWDHRVQQGSMGGGMSNALSRFGRQRGLAMFADWTERITAGEVPPAPPRPRGRERDLVITLWDWNGPTGFIHDHVASDKRHPSVNANGPIYGVDQYNGTLAVLDPLQHEASVIPVPVRDEIVRPAPTFLAPSPTWGEEVLWRGVSRPHTPMFDATGRVWMTARFRTRDNSPVFCTDGERSPFAAYFPRGGNQMQTTVFDPATGDMTWVDTCSSTHHLQFARDRDDTLFLGGDSEVIGWVNTRVFDETGDARAAVGWCPSVLDTNGDGTITEWVEPDEPVDPAKDKRIRGFPYGLLTSTVDGSMWWPVYQSRPARVVRLDRGPNPPETCKAELFQVPYDPEESPELDVYNPRGMDMDLDGVVWVAFGSGHMGRFDRRLCDTLHDPEGTGEHCPEGWTFYRAPGPNFKGAVTDGSTEWPYLAWVDQYDTLGLGANVPFMNGTASDSLLALMRDTGEFVVLRVPYPLGFYSRSLDGRIDDPDTGWKGRGIWSTYAQSAVWHIEGGKGTQGKVVKFQLRPHPLAK